MAKTLATKKATKTTSTKKAAAIAAGAPAKTNKKAAKLPKAKASKKAAAAEAPKDERPVLGKDADGKDLHIGDFVDHTEKGWTHGTVVQTAGSYKGEPAAYVLFPERNGLPWQARYSKLRVTGVNTEAVEALKKAGAMKQTPQALIVDTGDDDLIVH